MFIYTEPIQLTRPLLTLVSNEIKNTQTDQLILAPLILLFVWFRVTISSLLFCDLIHLFGSSVAAWYSVQLVAALTCLLSYIKTAAKKLFSVNLRQFVEKHIFSTLNKIVTNENERTR